MRLWLYASYSGSPVGFQLGATAEDSDTLIKQEEATLVKCCFGYQSLREARGKLLGSENWLLLKNFPRGQKDGRDFNLNIAWETPSEEEFRQLSAYTKANEEKLFAAWSSLVEIDEQDEVFGLRLNGSTLAEMRRAISAMPPDANLPMQEFRVRTVAGQEDILPERLRLAKTLGGQGQAIPIAPKNDGWYVLAPKKKEDSRGRSYPIAAAIVLAVLAALTWALSR